MSSPNEIPRFPKAKAVAIWLMLTLAVSLGVRAGTAYFLASHLADPGWFQYGSYSVFDQRTQNILDGKEPVFLLSDPSRTDLVQYPPGFPLFVAAVYTLSGERSAYAVLWIEWLLDAVFLPLLLIGVTFTAFGWSAAKFAGIFGAISPVMAFYGVTPTTEGPTTWLILAASWILLAALRRERWHLALAAGIVLGTACWLRVNPVLLVVPWAGAIVLFAQASAAVRLKLALALALGTIIVVAPITIRNFVVYNEIVVTGLNVGTNLWEGLGETELGRENGFKYGDNLMIETERQKLGLPADLSMTTTWPDGIRRDRERARESLAFIAEHPAWYAGVMLTRMYWMLKIFGEPGPFYGTAGINCTPDKCLPPQLRVFPATATTAITGMVQSVYRYTAIPLSALGIWFAFRRARTAAWLLLATVLYFLVPGTAAHTEIRYVLPMHAVLIVFAGVASAEIATWTRRRRGIPATAAKSV